MCCEAPGQLRPETPRKLLTGPRPQTPWKKLKKILKNFRYPISVFLSFFEGIWGQGPASNFRVFFRGVSGLSVLDPCSWPGAWQHMRFSIAIGLACYRGAEPPNPQKCLGRCLGAPSQAPSQALSRALSRAPHFRPALPQAPPWALWGVWGFGTSVAGKANRQFSKFSLTWSTRGLHISGQHEVEHLRNSIEGHSAELSIGPPPADWRVWLQLGLRQGGPPARGLLLNLCSQL